MMRVSRVLQSDHFAREELQLSHCSLFLFIAFYVPPWADILPFEENPSDHLLLIRIGYLNILLLSQPQLAESKKYFNDKSVSYSRPLRIYAHLSDRFVYAPVRSIVDNAISLQFPPQILTCIIIIFLIRNYPGNFELCPGGSKCLRSSELRSWCWQLRIVISFRTSHLNLQREFAGTHLLHYNLGPKINNSHNEVSLDILVWLLNWLRT